MYPQPPHRNFDTSLSVCGVQQDPAASWHRVEYDSEPSGVVPPCYTWIFGVCRISSICKRDQQVDLATTCETCQRHVDGLSHWIASPFMNSWLFSEDLHLLGEAVSFRTLMTGISDTENFFESGRKAILGGTTSDDEDVRDPSRHTDFKLVRTADGCSIPHRNL